MEKDKPDINVEKVVNHWVATSEQYLDTMMVLFKAKSFSWALFLGHISIEKMLKALYVQKFEKHAPFTHNLYRLAELVEIEISEEYADWLDEITTFNISARYDDYKKEFAKSCTETFTKDWIDKIDTLQSWIKKKL